jgi:FSR family fosmidomycin resistance protein-like MFS transporter
LRLLRQPFYLAVGLCHLSVDVLSGQVGLLLAVLSLRAGFNNATIGLIATAYTVVASLAQPVFGWITDRFEERWTAVGGVLWMAACFSLVYVLPGSWPVVFLIAAGLGTAAFHPAGAMKATQIGEVQMAGRAATAASIFFLFGQSGWAIGPIAGGLIVDGLGRAGLLIITGAVAAAGLFLALQRWPATTRPAARASHTHSPEPVAPAAHVATFALVTFLAGMPGWANTTLVTFAPKYFQDQGVSATIYGLVLGLLLAGSAIGGVAGAMVADRWSRRWTVTLALAGSAVPLFLFPILHGPWLYLVALLAGMLSGAPHSIFITLAQRALPGRAGLAAGMAMGLMFGFSALGTYVSGFAADRWGLLLVLQANAALVLLAAAVSLWLRAEPAVAPRQVVTAAD